MNQTQAIPYRQSFLRQQAQEAWHYFRKTGYPSSRDENWKFSNPTPWLFKSASLAAEKEEFIPEEFSSHIIQGAIPILILNDTISIPSELPEGIQIMDMTQAQSENYDFMGSVADYHTSSFSAENTALFQNGIVIHISKNTVLGKPLQLIHSIKRNKDSRIYPRVYVNVGANSQIEILQTEAGDDDHHHFVNSVVEVIVYENAQLKWTLIQERNIKTGQISSFNIALKKNATAIYNTFEFGGGFIRRDIQAHSEQSAEARCRAGGGVDRHRRLFHLSRRLPASAQIAAIMLELEKLRRPGSVVQLLQHLAHQRGGHKLRQRLAEGVGKTLDPPAEGGGAAVAIGALFGFDIHKALTGPDILCSGLNDGPAALKSVRWPHSAFCAPGIVSGRR